MGALPRLLSSTNRLQFLSNLAGAASGANGFTGDGGPATSAKLSFPTGMAIDGSGNIFFADYFNHRIRDVSGGNINTVAGPSQGFGGDGGPATSASLNLPRGVWVDGSSNLWISDTGNNRIREVVGGNINTVAGDGTAGSVGDGGPALSAQLNSPFAAILD